MSHSYKTPVHNFDNALLRFTVNHSLQLSYAQLLLQIARCMHITHTAQFLQLIRNANTILCSHYKWKIRSFWNHLKIGFICDSIQNKLPKLSCIMRLVPNGKHIKQFIKFENGVLFAFLAWWKLYKFNSGKQIAMNLLMSMISFHDFAF